MTTGFKTGEVGNKRKCRQSGDLAVGFLLNHHFLSKERKGPRNKGSAGLFNQRSAYMAKKK